MASRVCAATASCMLTKSLLDVFGDAGIQTTIFTLEDIDKIHWGYYPDIMYKVQHRDQPHTSNSIYEKIGASTMLMRSIWWGKWGNFIKEWPIYGIDRVHKYAIMIHICNHRRLQQSSSTCHPAYWPTPRQKHAGSAYRFRILSAC